MKRNIIIASVLALALFGGTAMAFEEQKSKGQSGSSGQAPSTALTTPTPPARSSSGTKVRVPGLGVIGEIPKMDFGLELLYGASQPKIPSNDDAQASGVMGRVTVPLKTPR